MNIKLSFFFSLLTLFSFSQVVSIHRYNERPEIATKLPSMPMKFNMAQDTIFVNIYADSLTSGYDVKLFVHFPAFKSIQGYSLAIGFPDGSYETFSQVIGNDHYAEFPVGSEAMKKLRNIRFDVISFETKGLSEPCVNIKTKDFFTNFLKTL